MSDVILPVTDASEAALSMKRSVTSYRMRENHPAINSVSQDTVPGSGSGDS